MPKPQDSNLIGFIVNLIRNPVAENDQRSEIFISWSFQSINFHHQWATANLIKTFKYSVTDNAWSIITSCLQIIKNICKVI